MKLKIRRKRVDGTALRQLLMGMITSEKFLEELSSFFDASLIEDKTSRLIAEWSVEYFKKYGKAPGTDIQNIFELRADSLQPSEREAVTDLLTSLSEAYEEDAALNIPYMLDKAEVFFKSQSLGKLTRSVNVALLDGEIDSAEGLLAGYKRVGRPAGLGENPFKNAESIAKAFERESDGLFTLPGALGRMLNDELHRGHFMGIMGPEKRGKTWWLNEIALRAAKARCNVALFEVGDMTREQVILRLSCRLCGKSHLHSQVGTVDVPVLDCLLGQEGRCRKQRKMTPLTDQQLVREDLHNLYLSGECSSHEPCSVCMKERFFLGSVWWRQMEIESPLTWREAWNTGNKFLGRIRGRDFRISVHPSESLSVSGLNSILDSWETFEGFVPDVIVIDYADNLAPEDRREEYRHQQNRTWKLLRKLSQDRQCLVVTATQSSGASYDQHSLSMKHYSEDKRKFAHVTSMIGLNQTPTEKRAGLMRINMLVWRGGEFHSEDEIWIAQCLKLGRPLVFSF